MSASRVLAFGGGGGKEGHAIQGLAGGHHAGGGQQSLAALEAHQVVQPRGYAPRPGGVGAQGEAGDAQGHGQGRAGTGAAGRIGRVDAVAAGAIGRTGAVEAGGELVEIALAEGHGAQGDQLLHQGRRALGHIGIGRAGRRGGDAGEVDVVLDGEGDAIERQLGGIAVVQGGEIGSSSAGVSRWMNSRYSGLSWAALSSSSAMRTRGVWVPAA